METFTFLCFHLAVIGLVTSQDLITVSGPLVDLYCWDTLQGIALDTGVQLRDDPFKHTVHCLVEVSVCRNSGFAIVHKPTGNTQYEVQYLLDEAGNQLAIDAMYAIPAGSQRNQQTGFIFSITGTADNSGDVPLLITDVNATSTTPTSDGHHYAHGWLIKGIVIAVTVLHLLSVTLL
mmetsp:Transcript_29615/g.48229  ORF Transcript_29615/g.48229 Transcript_29615/m.48229 type:complete len:177 (+) Transcript_29615:38-568(+)